MLNKLKSVQCTGFPFGNYEVCMREVCDWRWPKVNKVKHTHTCGHEWKGGPKRQVLNKLVGFFFSFQSFEDNTKYLCLWCAGVVVWVRIMNIKRKTEIQLLWTREYAKEAPFSSLSSFTYSTTAEHFPCLFFCCSPWFPSFACNVRIIKLGINSI